MPETEPKFSPEKKNPEIITLSTHDIENALNYVYFLGRTEQKLRYLSLVIQTLPNEAATLEKLLEDIRKDMDNYLLSINRENKHFEQLRHLLLNIAQLRAHLDKLPNTQQDKILVLASIIHRVTAEVSYVRNLLTTPTTPR